MSEEQDLHPLPNGWIWAYLGEISEKISPGFPSGKHNKEHRGVLHIRPMNISASGNIDLSVAKYVEETGYDPILKGDIIFNNTNSPELVGKTTYVNQDTNWAYSNHMTKIRINTALLDPAWIGTYLHTLYLQGYFKIRCTHHVNQASINSTYLGQKVPIPLPPLSEQYRIVTKIEQLFTQLDAGVASLKKVRAQIKRYRQAVLKAAFEGRLTKVWREEHTGNDPFQSSLIKQKSNVESIDLSIDYNLPKLPQNWCWTKFETVIRNYDGKRVPIKREDRKQIQGNFPYYGASGIIDHVNDYLFDGQYLLIGEDGANLLARSSPIAFEAKGKFWVNNHAHVIQPRYGIPLKFLEHYINSIRLEKYITGTAQPKMTQRAMNNIPIPLPQNDESSVIVEEIERLFSIADEIEKTIEICLKQTNNLRQSILKRAFEGKLVIQDPLDEPASELLKRIKAEKAKTGIRMNKGRRMRKPI